MKLLMIYCDRFAYTPAQKALEDQPDSDQTAELTDIVLGMIHAEAADEEDPVKVEKKLIKNLKWGARKNDTQKIVLHSFSHLSESKATPDFTRALLDRSAERLRNAGYEAFQTPYGYFLDLDLQAPGKSTARIFISF
jgi:hypothetical protein